MYSSNLKLVYTLNYPSGYQINVLYVFLTVLMRATYYVHLTLTIISRIRFMKLTIKLQVLPCPRCQFYFYSQIF